MDVKIVTICGSMRFEKEMQQIARELTTKNGYAVIQCIYGITKNETESEQNNIVKAHYKKIDICDIVYVVNIGGYIGTSTTNEIKYAKSKGKQIIYHEN